MSVTLRKKEITKNRYTFYLDIYESQSNRYREALRIYIPRNPKTKLELKIKKENTLLAESIRRRRELEILNLTHSYSREYVFVVSINNIIGDILSTYKKAENELVKLKFKRIPDNNLKEFTFVRNNKYGHDIGKIYSRKVDEIFELNKWISGI